MSFSISNFKTLFNKHGGIQKTNRWSVSGFSNAPAATGGIDDVEMSSMIQDLAFPGRQITSTGYDMFRNSSEMPTGYVNSQLTISWILTGDLFVKTFFEKWLELIVDPESYLVAYQDTYTLPLLSINLHDTTGKIKKTVQIDSVYPKSMKELALTSGDGAPSLLTIEFAYNDLRFATP